ncbi:MULTISPECIES: hypothetical protein [Bifidobacterium]|uniref:GTPase n=1 Tax=Bifidobacterium apousia TaxID=2750996 RepID=A0A556R5I9_9BIFI|nr:MULTISPECIES: hypothetical protein [Bifidobacterium]MBI0071371.1 hypothetical protein [Bifidobacterium sp. W8112]MBI0124365.1 hypothetical protein [Bifidobacterium apousia]MBI0137204.1 hypothetical protein [Bifidobacterium sp. W8120]TSJ84141.1 hypothetical protein FPK30_01340 [Bifidobacterium apousia]
MEQVPEEQDEMTRPDKPSRHSMIMRGIVTPIFGLLAVAAIVLGIMNATVWKPSAHVDAHGRTKAAYVVTDPGVLPLVDSRVTMRVDAASAGVSGSTAHKSQKPTICMALTTAKDAAGWTAGHDVARVRGLDDWQTLSVGSDTSPGKAVKRDQGVAFQDSDMWKQVTCSDSSVSMSLKTDDPQAVLLVAVPQGSPSLGLEMLWQRDKLPNFAMPFYFAGGLLALLAVLSATVFAMDPAKRRKQTEPEQESEETPEVSVAQALGSAILPGLGQRRSSTSGRRRRHARGQARQGDPGPPPRPPVVIDPRNRNMVADQQEDGDGRTVSGDRGADDMSSTRVISSQEMASYLARLAHEGEEER